MSNCIDKVTILIPLFNEADSVEELYEKIILNIFDCIKKCLIKEYEILFINDGSDDESGKIINKLIDLDSNVRMLNFRKNFGKSKALQSGFKYATGEIVITMDADLQDDPNEIQNFIKKYKKDMIWSLVGKLIDRIQQKRDCRANYLTK